jgi:hypothetical protein
MGVIRIGQKCPTIKGYRTKMSVTREDMLGRWRKGWDSNPRGTSQPLAVFKTAALNRSATLPLRESMGDEGGHCKALSGLHPYATPDTRLQGWRPPRLLAKATFLKAIVGLDVDPRDTRGYDH